MRRYIIGIIAALAALSCTRSGSDNVEDTADGTTSSFTAFVIDLIENKTNDDALPVPPDAFMSLPDPDGENNNVLAYQRLF